jgi:HupE / UreJ protein
MIVKMILFRTVCVWVAMVFGASAAHAHFAAGYDLRVVHFARGDNGMHAYFRLTLPLVVANGLGPKGADGFYAPALFTIRRIESAHAFFYPDVVKMRADAKGLGKLIANGHRLEIDGDVTKAEVMAVRVYPKGTVLPFNTLEEARQATAPGETYPLKADEVDAAFVMVDAHLFYPSQGEVSGLRLSSTLDNRVLGQPEVQNLLIDHAPGGEVVYKTSGFLKQPIDINPSRWSAASSFFRHGFEHFALGADHLLFVLCLALGAAALSHLVWRITGFTLGHAVSLTAGFFGYVPSGPWFVPAVEICIALSIILAAVAILFRKVRNRFLIWVTVAIGIVHGFGFSFALRDMLQIDAPRLIVSLGAFNLGVEAGQVMFAVAVWGAIRLLGDGEAIRRIRLERVIFGACVVTATVWIVGRSQTLIAAIF